MTRLCKNCGKEFEAPTKRLTCTRSCAVALSWKNPEFAARKRASISKNKQSPEAMARLAAHNERRWSRPGEREKMSEQNRREWSKKTKREKRVAGIKRSHRRPEMRAFYSRMRTAQWADDPEYRRKTTEGIQRSKGSPEYRALFGRLLKERWENPIWRKKYSDGIRREMNRPERKAQCSAQMREMWATNDHFRAMVAAATELYWSKPENREFQSRQMKALWSDPVWRMQTLNMMAVNPGAVNGGKIYRHLNIAADLMAEVDSVIPRALPDFMRMDIASDLTVALLEGDILLSDLKANAKEYISAHRKMFPDKWGPISLDAPLPGTENFTLADTLADDTPHF